MSSRARIFAAVTLLASCLAGPAAWAQVQNLEAGKTASQLFTGTCNACHKSPRGLLRTVSPGALPGFLKEHYTTSSEMASQLASFLVSNGANDARQAKQGTDKQGGADQPDRQGRKNRNAPNQEAAHPDDGTPPGEGGRQGRKRLTRPGEPAEEARPVANTPGEAFIERGGDGHKPKRLGKPGRPGTEEPSLANEPPKEPPKAEAGADDKGEASAKGEPAKSDVEGNSSNEAKSEPAKMEAPKTDAPAAASVPAPTPAPAIASGGSSEPAAPAPRQPAPVAASEPQAVTASAPPPPLPSGPPAPPISR
jgi:hypothetical protein